MANYCQNCSHWACQIEQSRSRHLSDFSSPEWAWQGQMDKGCWSGAGVSPASSVSVHPLHPWRSLNSVGRPVSQPMQGTHHITPHPPTTPTQHWVLTWLSSFNLYLCRKSHWENLFILLRAKRDGCLLRLKPSSIWQGVCQLFCFFLQDCPLCYGTYAVC